MNSLTIQRTENKIFQVMDNIDNILEDVHRFFKAEKAMIQCMLDRIEDKISTYLYDHPTLLCVLKALKWCCCTIVFAVTILTAPPLLKVMAVLAAILPRIC